LGGHQAQRMADWWTQYQGEAAQRQAAEIRVREAEGRAELTQAWGDKVGERLEVAMQAGAHLGLTDDEMTALRGTVGVKRFAEMLYKVGADVLAEDNSNVGTRATAGAPTPEQAEVEIKAFMADPKTREALFNPRHPEHKETVARQDALYRARYGGQRAA
jgi:hypothetical protein